LASEVRSERRGPVVVVTVDNPPVNALHPDVAEAIGARCHEASEDPDVRAIVLTGAGDKHFMAGGDIDFIRTLDAYRAERYVFAVQRMQDQLGLLPQPVVAALNGTTLGGGLELAMACDIRIAEEHAVFGQPEVSLGIIPGAGGTQNLPRLIPVGQAKKLLFTAERITAAEALAVGLVEEVVPRGTALDRAVELGEVIARNAPAAVAAAKRAVNLGLQTDLVDGHRVEGSLFAPLVETDDFEEGMRAFVEKRAPRYRRT
jgi:enoyl-CoA hydratase/carnithine racemase